VRPGYPETRGVDIQPRLLVVLLPRVLQKYFF
jgi:hypothetical protein